MRIAFYAPLKAPSHDVPSGDRRVGRLLVDALELAGHNVQLASTLRTYEGSGDDGAQKRLRDQGRQEGEKLVRHWLLAEPNSRPEIWFTYHVYHKAPDWLGHVVSSALGIPYVISEASYAPKRAGGTWALGHTAAADAIRAASLIVCPIRHDVPCLEPLMSTGGRIMVLPPFLEPSPYANARKVRLVHRQKLSAEHRLDPDIPWIIVAAMMRPGDKTASYLELAAVLRKLRDLPWQLLVVGDGDGRNQIEGAMEEAAPGKSRFLGERQSHEVAETYAAGDLTIWPAVNEAYGMALLEAQAAGIPVVSYAIRGVPDIVRHGVTGLLAPAGDPEALADCCRELLTDESRRRSMSDEAARFVNTERSVARASQALDDALALLKGRVAYNAVPASR